ncbi:MAG: hydrogenase maturation protease [Gammaproteobacteria bacterium]|nr:hydrogenase maturation protease [Gammaproteobacteria bacterium]
MDGSIESHPDEPSPDGQDRITVISYGNPSRGDDAIGPLMFDRLQNAQTNGDIPSSVTLVTDFQLQVEHILDFADANAVIFVDASLIDAAPFSVVRLVPRADHTFSSHALSPQSLLAVYESVIGKPAPPAQLLAVRAYDFDLGGDMSARARKNLDLAERFLRRQLLAQSSACRESTA